MVWVSIDNVSVGMVAVWVGAATVWIEKATLWVSMAQVGVCVAPVCAGMTAAWIGDVSVSQFESRFNGFFWMARCLQYYLRYEIEFTDAGDMTQYHGKVLAWIVEMLVEVMGFQMTACVIISVICPKCHNTNSEISLFDAREEFFDPQEER